MGYVCVVIHCLIKQPDESLPVFHGWQIVVLQGYPTARGFPAVVQEFESFAHREKRSGYTD
jgi:hypothetical protein